MDGISANSQVLSSNVDSLQRILPEPKSRLPIDFGSVLTSVLGAVGSATGTTTGIDPGYAELLNKQIETQQQMQLVSMESNVEKSKHETQMAAIRNVRVG